MLITKNLFLEGKTYQKTCSVSLWTPRLQSWSSEAGLRVQRAARDCVDFRFIRQYKKIFTVYWSLNLQCFTSLLLSVLFLIPVLVKEKRYAYLWKRTLYSYFWRGNIRKRVRVLLVYERHASLSWCAEAGSGSTRFQPETAQTSNSRILYRSLTHG